MAERVASVVCVWKDENIARNTDVVILNDSVKYEQMCKDLSFDERVFFYFQDEAEFRRAFDPDDTEFEFFLIEEE
jgi:hypothetical protein